MTRDQQTKADYVQTMFARVAPHYDRMNWLMTLGRHRAWHRFVAMQAAPPGGSLSVLDVGTGTCDIALTLAQGTACRVVGVDRSLDMMALGQEKVGQAGLDDCITLLPGDALCLPFADAAFDCVISGFALRNVASIPQALAEMARVVRPGGRVVCLEITAPCIPLFRQIYHFYFHRVVPLLGRLITGLPDYAYLPDSLDAFLSPAELKAIMEQVGLHEVSYTLLTWQTVAVHVGVKSS